MSAAAVEIRRFTREEYELLVAQGFFPPGQKIELVDGVLYEVMTPQSSRHAAGVRLVQIALARLYAEGFDLRCQMPLALGVDSEPEPDLAVVPGQPRDYISAHPGTAVLVVEVADSSLTHDRNKARLYARAGIPEFWLLDLVDGRLEVRRDPRDGTYATQLVLREGDSVAPLAHPAADIPVSGLLPRA